MIKWGVMGKFNKNCITFWKRRHTGMDWVRGHTGRGHTGTLWPHRPRPHRHSRGRTQSRTTREMITWQSHCLKPIQCTQKWFTPTWPLIRHNITWWAGTCRPSLLGNPSEAVITTVFLDDDAPNPPLLSMAVILLYSASGWWSVQPDPVETVIWPHLTNTNGMSVRCEYSVTTDWIVA